ncbi:MAG: hypothetical protein IKI57_00910 [Clostridia bacterium]|nr:hypothetical protein [Clostridia bacterium]
MDNAAKVLIIAGSILIAMLVISISMYLLSSFRDYYDRNTELLYSYQINSFNSDFIKYGNTISGADAFNILSKVSEVNSKHEYIIFNIASNGDIREDNFKKVFYFTENYMALFKYEYTLDSNGIVNSVSITRI